MAHYKFFIVLYHRANDTHGLGSVQKMVLRPNLNPAQYLNQY